MGSDWQLAIFVFAIAGALAMAGSAKAKDYFAGKKINVSLPASSGGSFHNYSIMVTQNMGRHIPGNLSMVAVNRPGTAGALASAFMHNFAAMDGTEIAIMAPRSITAPLLNKIDHYFGQGFYAPQDTPSHIVLILQRAFEETKKDPALIADIEKRNVELEPLTAAHVDDVIERGFAAVTPEVITMFRNLTVEKK